MIRTIEKKKCEALIQNKWNKKIALGSFDFYPIPSVFIHISLNNLSSV